MSLSDARNFIDLAVALGLPGLGVWFVRDRKKAKAASDIAVGSVRSELFKSDTTAVEAHITYVEKAFAYERASMQREIDKSTERIKQLDDELHRKDRLIEELRAQLGALKDQVEALYRRLNVIDDNARLSSPPPSSIPRGSSVAPAPPVPPPPPENTPGEQF